MRRGVERMETLLPPPPSTLPAEPKSLPTTKQPKHKLRYVPFVPCESDAEALPRFFQS